MFKKKLEEKLKIRTNFQAEKRLLVGNIIWPLQRQKDGGIKKRIKRRTKDNSNGIYSNLKVSSIPKEYCRENDIQNESQILRISNTINNLIKQDTIEIFCGLEISRNGIVRLISALNHVSFGINIGNIQQIEFKKQCNLVNIQTTDVLKELARPFQWMNAVQIAEGLRILHSVPNQYNQQLIDIIEFFKSEIIRCQEIDNTLSQYFAKQIKEEEFEQFAESCFEFLKSSQAQYSMYTYNIGRVNPNTKQMELKHTGFSKEYLDLIGIHSDTMAQFFLRKKKIDLLLDTLDFNKLSINALVWMNKCKPKHPFDPNDKTLHIEKYTSEPVSSQIVTFDGFNMTLTQRLRIFYAPFGSDNKTKEISELEDNLDCRFGYFFHIFELDVELSELEALIAYRERLLRQANELSQEDFLKRELSLMFEDVEYSVRSQEFLDKYYAESQSSLSNMHSSKEISEGDMNRRCNSRDLRIELSF